MADTNFRTADGIIAEGSITGSGGSGVDLSAVDQNIIPDADITRDLGSPTNQWKDIYVGPGSFYVNGQKVLEDNSGTIQLSADVNQNLALATSGTGDIEITPASGSIQVKGNIQVLAGKNLTSSDGLAISVSAPITLNSNKIEGLGAPVSSTDAANKAYVDGQISGTTNAVFNDVSVDGTLTSNDITSATVTVSRNAVISGDLTVNGTTTTINSGTLSIADTAIILNSDFTSGTPSANAEITVTRGDSNSTAIRWNETSDVWQTTNDGSVYNDILTTGSFGAEEVQDIVGAMVSTNSEFGLDVTYDDATGKLNFDVNDVVVTLAGDVTGFATMTNLGDITISAVVGDDSHAHSGYLSSTGADSHSGNITPNTNNTLNLGSSGLKYANMYATTFNGTATVAQYADLAEKYTSDAEYAPGTVVMFGGEAEVTVASAGSTAVAGIVSTDPAFLMNGDLEGGVEVALRGRVPCKVSGAVSKGDLMVAGDNGVAVADNGANPSAVVGRAIEANEGGEGVIEVVVA
jgi:hypothetical protein